MRWSVVFFNKQKILKLMAELRMFWTVHDFDESGASTIMVIIKRGVIFYTIWTSSCGFVATIIPIVFNFETILPFKVWIPDVPYSFQVNNFEMRIL